MIANIDDNVGEFRKFLDDEGLTENTIFIFTDNGTSSGAGVFNDGMRGKKGASTTAATVSRYSSTGPKES